MPKCSCYRKTDRYLPYACGECLGTKEIDPCLCGGYRIQCDFYPGVRDQAAQEKEYPKVIAVDFDGTLCENKWPDIGEPNLELFEYLKDMKTLGAKIILWTNRSGFELNMAVDWCREHELIFDAVNENLPEIIEYFGSDTRKIFANEYIDDKMCTKFKLPFTTK